MDAGFKNDPLSAAQHAQIKAFADQHLTTGKLVDELSYYGNEPTGRKLLEHKFAKQVVPKELRKDYIPDKHPQLVQARQTLGAASYNALRTALKNPATHAEAMGIDKGWGIGLTIVKGIAQAHGGEVTLESSAGKGTTFRMRLPLN